MSPPSGGAPAEGGSTFQLVFLSAGVLASFIAFGYAQEAVTKTPFGAEGELFKFSTFLVLLQSVGNAAVAAAVSGNRVESGLAKGSGAVYAD
ncbi:hypothetical protein M885DRAFT_330699 [Pelagophyceae sp. CCMP2097]|nr:hypothetical protein M885DRAFT_330699 [Pelagophyceae sp. CCMP2097]